METSARLARNAVRVWMRQVLEEKQWTAADWAKIAQTSPTNITRVLSPTSEIVPSAATIAKLASAAGSQPNLGAYHRQSERTVPLVMWGNWNAMHGKIGSVTAPVGTTDKAFAVKIQSDMMNLAGILPGDTVIAEPSDWPEDNRIVLAELKSDGSPIIARVMTPWLMPQSSTRHDPHRLEDVRIVALCVSVVRAL